MGYCLQDRKESDTTEQKKKLTVSLSLILPQEF